MKNGTNRLPLVGESRSFIVDQSSNPRPSLPPDGDAAAGLKRGIRRVVQQVDEPLLELIGSARIVMAGPLEVNRPGFTPAIRRTSVARSGLRRGRAASRAGRTGVKRLSESDRAAITASPRLMSSFQSSGIRGRSIVSGCRRST